MDEQTKFVYELMQKHAHWGEIIGNALVAKTPKKRIEVLKTGIFNGVYGEDSRYSKNTAGYFLINRALNAVNYEEILKAAIEEIKDWDFTWRDKENNDD
jgi:hypothetical protein